MNNTILTFDSMVKYIESESNLLNSLDQFSAIIKISRPEVIYQSEYWCDVQYCIDNNIVCVQETNMDAHCVVCTNGNLIVAIKSKLIDNGPLYEYFAKKFIKFLQDKNLNATMDGNDILVDGFKVASSAEGCAGKYRYMGFQISLNQDLDLIKNVCKKPMVKIPKGLSDYGLTTEEVVAFCEDCLSKL